LIVRHNRSINTLSIQRPHPSMLIAGGTLSNVIDRLLHDRRVLAFTHI
jgi:lipoprotein signal peptidase